MLLRTIKKKNHPPLPNEDEVTKAFTQFYAVPITDILQDYLLRQVPENTLLMRLEYSTGDEKNIFKNWLESIVKTEFLKDCKDQKVVANFHFLYGFAYFNIDGNIHKAEYHLKQAAMVKHPQAELYLGLNQIQYGSNKEQATEEALRHFKLAHAHGSVRALLYLALFGKELIDMELLLVAAKAQDGYNKFKYLERVLQFRPKLLRENGISYEDAAKAGELRALFRLAQDYREKFYYEKAALYYRPTAERGHREAKEALKYLADKAKKNPYISYQAGLGLWRNLNDKTNQDLKTNFIKVIEQDLHAGNFNFFQQETMDKHLPHLMTLVDEKLIKKLCLRYFKIIEILINRKLPKELALLCVAFLLNTGETTKKILDIESKSILEIKPK